MPRILLVRHGQAAASFTDDLDPGLDELGKRQAAAVAQRLASEMPVKIISSPLKRATETAEPFRELQGLEVQLEPRVSELPSVGMSLSERGPWIRGVMQGNWSDQAPELLEWRQALVDCLKNQTDDCVIFSHYVAINVATAFAQGEDRVTVFRPDNASVTVLSNEDGRLVLISRGDERVTTIN